MTHLGQVSMYHHQLSSCWLNPAFVTYMYTLYTWQTLITVLSLRQLANMDWRGGSWTKCVFRTFLVCVGPTLIIFPDACFTHSNKETHVFLLQEVSIAIYLHLSWGSNQDSLCMCPSLNHLVGVTHAMYVRLRGDILLAAGLLHNKKVLIDTLGFS